MSRRDFLRCIGWMIAAVLAGKPIAQAWAAAIGRQRRREMIIAELQYQARQAMNHIGRQMSRQLYGAAPLRDDDYIVYANGYEPITIAPAYGVSGAPRAFTFSNHSFGFTMSRGNL